MGKSKTQEVRVGKQQGSRSAGSSSQSPNPVSSSAPAQSTTTTTTTSSSSSTLRWPDLPFPGRELVLKELIADQVLLLPEFFTPKDCARWTAYLESSGSVAMEPSPAVPKRGEAVRSNERFSVQDEAFAARLHRLLAPYIDRLASRPAGSKPKALNPNIRIYRYRPGHEFRKHYDDSVKVGTYTTQWTLLIYLSGEEDGVEGGETAFYVEHGKGKGTEVVVAPLHRGTALLHRHGQDCLLHEGKTVGPGGGDKWVLRSDICF